MKFSILIIGVSITIFGCSGDQKDKTRISFEDTLFMQNQNSELDTVSVEKSILEDDTLSDATEDEIAEVITKKTDVHQILLTTINNTWDKNTKEHLNSVRIYLEKELKSNSLSIKNENVIDIKCATDGKLCAYTFTYSSGGTRGDISNPILQYKQNDSTFLVESLFEYGNKSGKKIYIESTIDKIYKLKSETKELYLLYGEETNDRNWYRYNAWVVEIINNKINLEYPAFIDSSSYIICDHEVPDGNTHLKFNEKEQIFQILELGSHDHVSYKNFDKEGYTDIVCKQHLHFKFEEDKFKIVK